MCLPSFRFLRAVAVRALFGENANKCRTGKNSHDVGAVRVRRFGELGVFAQKDSVRSLRTENDRIVRQSRTHESARLQSDYRGRGPTQVLR
jgi:hypothetical protein